MAITDCLGKEAGVRGSCAFLGCPEAACGISLWGEAGIVPACTAEMHIPESQAKGQGGRPRVEINHIVTHTAKKT